MDCRTCSRPAWFVFLGSVVLLLAVRNLELDSALWQGEESVLAWRPCLGIKGMIGNNFNRLITLYKGVRIVESREDLEFLATDDIVPHYYQGEWLTWYGWYSSFVEMEGNELPIRSGSRFLCKEIMDAQTLYDAKVGPDDLKLYSFFRPKFRFRDEAEEFLTKIKRKNPGKLVATVHSRNFEGQCMHFVRSYAAKKEPLWYCPVNFDSVSEKIMPALGLDQSNFTLVLCSDKEEPEADSTFPFIFTGSFLAEIWLMVLSDYHIGTKASTLSSVVAKWRMLYNTSVFNEI